MAHTHTQPFYGSVEFVRDNPGEPVPEDRYIYPLTRILFINHPNLLSPSTTIHGILRIQSTCSTVFFHNLSPSFLWSTVPLGLVPSTSYSIHFFTKSLSSFRSTCPYHCNLMATSTFWLWRRCLSSPHQCLDMVAKLGTITVVNYGVWIHVNWTASVGLGDRSTWRLKFFSVKFLPFH